VVPRTAVAAGGSAVVSAGEKRKLPRWVKQLGDSQGFAMSERANSHGGQVAVQHEGRRLREIRQRIGGCGASAAAASATAAGRVVKPAGSAPEHLYVVVHDIDARPLRSEAVQAALASLASIHQVHMIASCSHRNASLMWDAQKARQFSWRHVEKSTAVSYAFETQDTIHELMASLQGVAAGHTGEAALVVLKQLNARAQQAFVALARYQIDHPSAAGLSLAEFQNMGRGQWFATSSSALRTQLSEFESHHLIRTRTGRDGTQCYYCVQPLATLQQIVDALKPAAGQGSTSK